MTAKTRRLRELLAGDEFLYMPSAATPLEGRLAEAMGTPLVYTGGYASGASRAISEPLLTMDEQVRIAGDVARAVGVPLVADAGAGFGEPLHTMRTVREFAAALPEASTLSRLSGARDPARRIRRQDQIRLPAA
jgi:2-methylisocitrate lyase-like PEP mutase family enzyme